MAVLSWLRRVSRTWVFIRAPRQIPPKHAPNQITVRIPIPPSHQIATDSLHTSHGTKCSTMGGPIKKTISSVPIPPAQSNSNLRINRFDLLQFSGHTLVPWEGVSDIFQTPPLPKADPLPSVSLLSSTRKEGKSQRRVGRSSAFVAGTEPRITRQREKER